MVENLKIDKLGNKPASWVIVNKQTNQAVLETFNEALLPHINTNKYKAMPIYDYLAQLNRINHV